MQTTGPSSLAGPGRMAVRIRFPKPTDSRASRAPKDLLSGVEHRCSTAWSDGLPPSIRVDAPIPRDGCHRGQGREVLRGRTTPGRNESVSISKTRRVSYASPLRPQETQKGYAFGDTWTAENKTPRNDHSDSLFQF
jgi:hypothetical protein